MVLCQICPLHSNTSELNNWCAAIGKYATIAIVSIRLFIKQNRSTGRGDAPTTIKVLKNAIYLIPFAKYPHRNITDNATTGDFKYTYEDLMKAEAQRLAKRQQRIDQNKGKKKGSKRKKRTIEEEEGSINEESSTVYI